MKFEVTATIKEVGAIETVGAKGFQKRNLILTEQSGQYENLVCVEFSGDKLTAPEQFAAGQTVTVSGFINCREWNDKYFTSLRGSFINAGAPAGGGDPYSQAPAAPSYSQPQQGYAQPQAPQPNPGYAAPQSTPAPAPPFPVDSGYAEDTSVDDIPF